MGFENRLSFHNSVSIPSPPTVFWTKTYNFQFDFSHPLMKKQNNFQQNYLKFENEVCPNFSLGQEQKTLKLEVQNSDALKTNKTILKITRTSFEEIQLFQLLNSFDFYGRIIRIFIRLDANCALLSSPINKTCSRRNII